jgi:ribose 5-phosphate isomerase B
MKIAIGSDHAGFELRKTIIQHLESKGLEVMDVGTHGTESTHYPIYAQIVGKAVASGEADFGILICGTGVGVGISANKVPGIRAATVSDTYSARMARAHNNANVLAIGARVIGSGLAVDIVDTWLAQDFEGGRHKIRVDLIGQIEAGEDITGQAQ